MLLYLQCNVYDELQFSPYFFPHNVRQAVAPSYFKKGTKFSSAAYNKKAFQWEADPPHTGQPHNGIDLGIGGGRFGATLNMSGEGGGFPVLGIEPSVSWVGNLSNEQTDQFIQVGLLIRMVMKVVTFECNTECEPRKKIKRLTKALELQADIPLCM